MENEQEVDLETLKLHEAIHAHAAKNKYTYKVICEHIAKANLFKEPKTGEEIFKYSPTGELWQISFWYSMACAVIGLPDGTKVEDLIETPGSEQ